MSAVQSSLTACQLLDLIADRDPPGWEDTTQYTAEERAELLRECGIHTRETEPMIPLLTRRVVP